MSVRDTAEYWHEGHRSKRPAEMAPRLSRAAISTLLADGTLIVEGADEAADLSEYTEVHWVWAGAFYSDGRARIRINRENKMVTRVLWTTFRKQPDNTLVLKRTCDEEKCVNPWHRELQSRGSHQVKSASPSEELEAVRAELGAMDKASRLGVMSIFLSDHREFRDEPAEALKHMTVAWIRETLASGRVHKYDLAWRDEMVADMEASWVWDWGTPP